MKTYENYIKNYSNKKLIIIDIQPSYRIHMNMDIQEFTDWLNYHSYFDILYLYNGPDLGYEDEHELKNWLYDYELKEDILSDIRFFEKNYGFFRDFMDSGVDDETIIKIGKYLIKNNEYDIQLLSENQKEELQKITNLHSRYFNGEYAFYITELKEELKSFLNKRDRPLCIGGGQYQCFKEVMLLLAMLDIEWDEESQFIY